MTYLIKGLPRARFEPLLALSDAELAARGARRVVADAVFGFPCRVSLEDAAAGEALILLNHVSHDVDGPYRATHAILVRENAQEVAPLVDRIPPVFERRTLSLRAFDGQGDLVASRVAGPGEHDGAIRDLLSDPRVDHIDAHNAGHGCFSARIDRYMEAA
ncbi:MAG TPA: DUF1203 domain-containing protein [Croceibacterium sp.]|nr:DUF1203 domain-containing protein [Croceibacterium sp.]